MRSSAPGETAEGTGGAHEGEKTLSGRPTRRITISKLRNDSADPPSDTLGKRLIEAYLDRIHQRFPFIVRSDVWQFHRKRHILGVGVSPPRQDSFALFVLYMVYAIGALNLRLTGAYTDTAPEKFYISRYRDVFEALVETTMGPLESGNGDTGGTGNSRKTLEQ